jgi:EpsI family protein
VMALHGAKMVRIVALPILYLFCAIPIWSYLTPLLQDTTAQVATQMSRALGVPVYLEGIYMTIPDGVFLVAEVCAGISYLLAALSLGGFSALLNLRGTWTRLALVILALGAGLVFNWIRVAGIVLIGHHSNMQSPIVHSHITYGWVLFLLVVLFVLVCCRFLERVDVSNERRGYSPQTPRTDSIAQINDSPDKNTRTMWAMAISCAVMLAVPTYASIRTTPASLHSAADFLPELVGRHSDWLLTPATAPPHGWTASLLGPDLNVRASFIKGQQRLDLQLGYFASQHQGSEAVNDRHAKFDTASWQRVSQTISAEHVSIGPNLKVNEWSIRRTNTTERRLVWWWYWVDQQFTADPVQAKILQIRSIFSGHQQAAIVVISSPNLGTIENTRNEMVAWLRESATPLALGLSKLSRAPPPGGPCDT